MTNDNRIRLTNRSRPSRSAFIAEAMMQARTILRRFEDLEPDGSLEFTETWNREVAALRLMIDLLDGPYLTLAGLKLVRDMIGWSDDWVSEIEAEYAEEAGHDH